MRVPSSTAEVLMDLLEEQESAVQTIAVHLSVGQDLSPRQLEAMLQLKRRFEENCKRLEAMIEGWRDSDSLAQAG
jgi:archaellum component FlaC